ncbi:MAG TPA: hypothetical protein VJH71_01795 [Candidatus Paceibacterota bacterium]
MFFKKIISIHNIIALVILVGSAFWLYNSLPQGNGRSDLYTSKIFEARVTQIIKEEKNDSPFSRSSDIVQTLKIEVKLPDKEKEAIIENDLIEVDEDDSIYVRVSSLGTSDETYDIIDANRNNGMLWLAALFAVIITLIGGVKGFSEAMFTFILPMILLSATLIRICYKKGQKPRWQWGIDTEID